MAKHLRDPELSLFVEEVQRTELPPVAEEFIRRLEQGSPFGPEELLIRVKVDLRQAAIGSVRLEDLRF